MKVILWEYDLKCSLYKRSLQNYYAVHTLKCVTFAATPPLCILLLKLLHSEAHHAFLSYIYIQLTDNHDKPWSLKMVPIR